MYLHKENRELFKDVITLASERMGVAADIVEKDYYVTMILRVLSEAKYTVVFKGGTSLSKAFGVIDRFSEDIDITFMEHLGENRRKHLKYEILKPIEEELGLEIKNWDHIESDKDYNHYDYYYNSVLDNSLGGLPPYVKLETALMSYAFPTVEQEIDNYMYQALSGEEPELLEKYGLNPFTMRVQSIERTLIDKIFALCDYYLQNRANRNSRHLYDVYKLAAFVSKDDKFRKLVLEVREHRCGADGKIAPSARPDVNVKELIQRICAEDFYKQDYADTTMRLISDALDYEIVKNFYLEFTEDLF
ncbi:MAG: nucleotidyl transferase AbiEii/AbiGii toxin family protein [Clostridium sp.]|nr:nucleotidyl transferase AbiEii/AbiGii toxin family protein [Clostridium sp.]